MPKLVHQIRQGEAVHRVSGARGQKDTQGAGQVAVAGAQRAQKMHHIGAAEMDSSALAALREPMAGNLPRVTEIALMFRINMHFNSPSRIIGHRIIVAVYRHHVFARDLALNANRRGTALRRQRLPLKVLLSCGL